MARSRRWGQENYIELIKWLVSDCGLKVVLIGSIDDRPDGDEIQQATASGKVVNLAGRTSIREAAAILSCARVFVGNDSGPAHLAGAVGVPIVVLSGADDPRSTSPMAVRKELIYLDKLDCISCVKNVCPLKGDDRMQCMTGITVEMVKDSVKTLLD